MIQYIRRLALCCALLASLSLAACGGNQPVADSGMTVMQTGPVVSEPDPEAAIEKIYETVTIDGLSDASEEDLTDKFFIDTSLLDEFYVRYSSGRFGVADVFILKPSSPDDAPKVREMLESVKLSRIKEFENYDVYDSYQIAQDAQIFEQGGYIIMLTLADTEGARSIIDQYIPRT